MGVSGSHPSCLLASILSICACFCLLQLLPPNIDLCSCLYPSHPIVPFLPPCSFKPAHGPISSLYILCQYLSQPAHHPKYLDQFLTVLLATFTTGLVFMRLSKQGVATLWTNMPIKELYDFHEFDNLFNPTGIRVLM